MNGSVEIFLDELAKEGVQEDVARDENGKDYIRLSSAVCRKNLAELLGLLNYGCIDYVIVTRYGKDRAHMIAAAK